MISPILLPVHIPHLSPGLRSPSNIRWFFDTLLNHWRRCRCQLYCEYTLRHSKFIHTVLLQTHPVLTHFATVSFHSQTHLPFIHSTLTPTSIPSPSSLAFYQLPSLPGGVPLNKGSGHQPGGLLPDSAQNLGETGLEIWTHERASDVCIRMVEAVMRDGAIWRGNLLCCQSVVTPTLPQDLVKKVLQNMKILNSSCEVERRGLSLYYPGGRTAFEASDGGFPVLVMGRGVSKSHSGADPRYLDYSNATCLGVPGCIPPV